MRRKRNSKRRWKARVNLGRWIPWLAIMEHRLTVPEPRQQAFNLDAVRWLG